MWCRLERQTVKWKMQVSSWRDLTQSLGLGCLKLKYLRGLCVRQAAQIRSLTMLYAQSYGRNFPG